MTTLTSNQLRDALYDWANSVLNETPDIYKIIYADQNFPKISTEPVITFRVTSVGEVGEDHVSTPDDTGLSKISGNVEFILQIQGFGKKNRSDTDIPLVLDALTALRRSLYNPVISEALRLEGIVFVTTEGNTEDISGLDESEFEERASLDIRFRYGLNNDRDVNLGIINNVHINYSVTPCGDDESIDDTIIVNGPERPGDFCPIGQKFISSPTFDASDYSLRNAVVIGDTIDYQDLGEGSSSFVVIPIDSSPSNRRNVKFHTKFRTKPFSISNFQKAGFGSGLGSARVGLLTVPSPDNRILFSFNDTFITDTVLLSGINDTDVFDIELTIIVDDTTIHSFGKILDINGVEVASFDETEPGMLLPTRNDPFVAASFNSELPTVKEFFYSGINYPGEPCTGT